MITDKMIGNLPAGANMQGADWLSLQLMPKSIEQALKAGAVITLELKPGTGDVRFIATQYGKAIKI